MEYSLNPDDMTSIRSFCFAVGFIPLLNLTLIGTLLYVARARRFRSSRNLPADTTHAAAGFTFFNLHFLALGGVFVIVAPVVIAAYAQFVEYPLQTTADRVVGFFPRYEDTVPWFVLECVILCAAISGPPLVLSWIAGFFARRCAAKLPPLRFKVMTGLISFGFACLALTIMLTPVEFAEEQDIALDFQIVDKDSGQPIAGAYVRISDTFNDDWVTPHALAGPDGRARLTGGFAASGQRNAFRTMGEFSPWGRWLEVSAANHQTLRVALPEIVGADLGLERRRDHTVELANGKTPDGSFRDIAGAYVIGGSGFGFSAFAIAPDGRFVWLISGCVPPDFQQYGYLKRNEEEIELVRIPHPGFESDPALNSTLRVIGWRDELYITSRDDRGLRLLCEAALSPQSWPEWEDDISGGYVLEPRSFDRAQLRTALPGIPLTAWLKFAANELRHRPEERNVRDSRLRMRIAEKKLGTVVKDDDVERASLRR